VSILTQTLAKQVCCFGWYVLLLLQAAVLYERIGLMFSSGKVDFIIEFTVDYLLMFTDIFMYTDRTFTDVL